MDSELEEIDTLEDAPTFVDPAVEVQESVKKVIDDHKEEIFGSLTKMSEKKIQSNFLVH